MCEEVLSSLLVLIVSIQVTWQCGILRSRTLSAKAKAYFTLWLFILKTLRNNRSFFVFL